MKKTITLLVLILMGVSTVFAQQRYIDQVFSDVEITTDVIYGVNATVLFVPVTGEAVPVPLYMDVYEPAGDTLEERPLVLYFHSGNFLPDSANQNPVGTRRDSACVEIATRLAKMGYVVASVDYRDGWNPTANEQSTRVYTLINAAYRGLQDCHTAVKFFRRNHFEMGNTFGIDPDKVVAWGQGTGGYISLQAAILDEYIEIPLTPGGKFLIEVDSNLIPMVIEGVNGDINCDSVGIVPPNYPGFPAGDTLNYPNHVGYSGDINLAVNMGGAFGDTSWMDVGQPPIISYHVPTDPFAPYVSGLVIVPVLQLPVVEVFGSYTAQEISNRMGNNDVFAGMTYEGDYSATANSRNDGYDGLFPLYGSIPEDSAPWDWWNPNRKFHQNGLQTNPDMSGMKARGYIDTIIAYYAPRGCEVLGLDCAMTNVRDVPAHEYITVAPVPADNYLRVQSKNNERIQTVHIYDMGGRLLQTQDGERSTVVEVNRNDLPAGQYILRVFFEDAVTSQFILFQ